MEVDGGSEKKVVAPTNGSKNNTDEKMEIYKARLASYYKLLTQGCGRIFCDNCICISNPGVKRFKLSQSEVISLAMNISKLPEFEFQCTFGTDLKVVPDFIDMEKFQQLQEECSQSKNFTPMIRLIGNVFGNSESLSISFLKNPKQIKVDGKDCGLDLESVRKFYTMISEMPTEVQDVLLSSTERIIVELKYASGTNPLTLSAGNSPKTFVNKGSLRKYIILMENPKLLDEKYSEKVTGQLLNRIVNLPTPCQDFICDNYLSLLEERTFKDFLHILQNFIAIRILSNPNMILNNDLPIVDATKILGWLYNINKNIKCLTFKDFYNEMVNEHLNGNNKNLRVDFLNWVNTGKSKFTFCNYPFILNPEMKSQILNIEALISQRKKQDETIFSLIYGVRESPYFLLKVKRGDLIHDSIHKIGLQKAMNPEDLKKQLRVQFSGEEGIDEGGVRKEWFQLVVEDLFSVKYGMFIQDDETRSYWWFNHKSEDITAFELLGNVLGLAIYNAVILDLHFPLVVYKKLCGMKCTLDDLQHINPGLYTGLTQLLAYNGQNIEEDFQLHFQITISYFGATETHDLKPNGGAIPVTLENRQEYVDLYVKYLLEESIYHQFDAFKSGFMSVCDGRALKLFEPEELQLLICGSPVLDFYELEKSTHYDNGYTEDSHIVKIFWEVVHSLSETEKKKLLFFATGSDRCPIGGLGKLNFVITKHGGDSDRCVASLSTLTLISPMS
eukprot:TRINITY_DN5997_c0_g1_i2.p1 TRINITY_DN5997_c0_g1~~TRINITY_DN5997_c0_g1_i2.p1  ORF type:complete len:745 (-),score=142.97 TRINITY_DN5997_c0_g1_i2:829-3012(-)